MQRYWVIMYYEEIAIAFLYDVHLTIKDPLYRNIYKKIICIYK